MYVSDRTATAPLGQIPVGAPLSQRNKGRYHKYTIAPCSRIRGRERWQIDKLEGNPKLAATIEALLRSEAGIEEVRANPVTGRVLVLYDADSFGQSIEALIRRAVEFGPMSDEEFSRLRSNPQRSSIGGLIAAELCCTALKLMLFGAFCPTALYAAGLLLLFGRTLGSPRVAADRAPLGIVADEPRGVEHNG